LEDRHLLSSFLNSVNVAVIGGTYVNTAYTDLPTALPELSGMSFTSIDPANVSAAHLAPYDTVVFNVASPAIDGNTGVLSAQAKADLVSFVGSGHKMIIYDSECTWGGSVDYNWLPFPFTTNNPGQMGANGTLKVVENNTLASDDSADPYYIDAGYLSSNTDAVGDANVIVTQDPNWFISMSATNTNGVTGPVHIYSEYSNPGGADRGLMIYNGLDVDYLYNGDIHLQKIWIQELKQPFNPSGLPHTVAVVGISLTPPTSTDFLGHTHTLTATVNDNAGHPSPGIPVTFTILSGPNAGASGTLSPSSGITDANGKVTFTYTGKTVGVDTIAASFQNQAQQTITSAQVTVTWTSAGSPPVSGDDTYWPHSGSSLNITAPGVLGNDHDPDPSHVLTAALATGPSHGSLRLHGDGSFVYTPQAGYLGPDSFAYTATDGFEVGNLATVNLNVVQTLGIVMDPRSDSGTLSTDQITNVKAPVFMGTTEPGATISVYALHAGAVPAAVTPTLIGQTTGDANGNWTITSSSLVDGSYTISVTEDHPQSQGRVLEVQTLTAPVVIDTVAPRVAGLTLQPMTGRVLLTFHDDSGGLAPQSIATASNYALMGLHTPTSWRWYVTSATPSSAATTNDQVVTLLINKGKRLQPGTYVVKALSGGITDVAGNNLDGEFNGKFVSGNGTAGGNFGAVAVAYCRRGGPITALTTQQIVRANARLPQITLTVPAARSATPTVKKTVKVVTTTPAVRAARLAQLRRNQLLQARLAVRREVVKSH
jgi:hypothetical protein